MLRIRNWSKFQHYKFRSPAWIKLYRELLDDPEWHALSGESAKGLIMLWLIASEADGYLPASNVLAFRLRISENRVIALLSDCSNWFEGDASTLLAGCYQRASTEKSRDRVEKSREEKTNAVASQLLVPESLWDGFVEMRKKIRKPMTPRAEALIGKKLKTLAEAGNDPVEVVEQSIRNCWQDVFEVRKERVPNGANQPKSFDAIRNEGTDAALGRVLELGRYAVEKAGEAFPAAIGRADTIDVSRAPKRHTR